MKVDIKVKNLENLKSSVGCFTMLEKKKEWDR